MIAIDSPIDASQGATEWQRCPLYRDLRLDGFTLVSFDVFDTVLHRAARRPRDVFLEIGHRAAARGLMDEAVDAHAFAALRVQMEKNARAFAATQRRTGEVTIDDIWRQAPSFLGAPQALQALELDVELELSVANPYAVSYIRELKRRGMRICLTSDTYFSSDFIATLMVKAGVTPDHYAAVFASCEHDANKATGTLFERVLAHFSPIARHEILHVGDDLTNDCIQPARFGIAHAHVHTSHQSQELLQSLALLGRDEAEDNLAPVRLLGRAATDGGEGGEGFFLEFGAVELGPAVAAFCAWVVADAARRGLTKICPIMREGAIFGRLMRRAAAALAVPIEVEELYVSRRAAFLPVMRRLDARAIAQYQGRRSFTLRDLVEELELPLPATPLLEQIDQPFKRVAATAELTAWLATPAVQQAAIQASAAARALLVEYVATVFAAHRAVAMVDLGPAGNTLAWVAECLGEGAPSTLVNYLFHATPDVVPNGARGHLYAVFLGDGPSAVRLARQFNRSHEPFEILLTGAHETTVGYRRPAPGEAVVPVTQRVFDASGQAGLIAAAERGIDMAWEHLEHCLLHVPLDHLLSSATRHSLLGQLCRVLELPTEAEARNLGDLVFDDNAGSRHFAPICGERDREALRAQGPAAFVASFRRRWGYHAADIRWPQGVVTREYPGFLSDIYRQTFSDMEYGFVCKDLIDRALDCGIRLVTVYGGGKVGFEMVTQAERQGLSVDMIVDSNPAMHGLAVLSRPVVSLATAERDGCGAFLVASVAFAEEITGIIKTHYRARSLPVPAVFSIADTHD